MKEKKCRPSTIEMNVPKKASTHTHTQWKEREKNRPRETLHNKFASIWTAQRITCTLARTAHTAALHANMIFGHSARQAFVISKMHRTYFIRI